MPYLDKALRKQLATTIQQARVVAEDGAADALRRLGVAEDKAPAHVTGEAADLRVKLRAHARTLGDGWDAEKKRLLSTDKLVETVAFEHWHRMLFGRFLVERGLLIHPDLGVAVAQEELAELAAEEGLADGWALVEKIAAPALPAVFKPEDPALAVTLAPEFAKRLRDLAAALPSEVFIADDSLGWTYQFWRAAEKDAVNKAGGKIGAAELPAVTQLFTEPYMVKFLLDNTLGAWWAGKVLARDPGLARGAADEAALRAACALPNVEWEFLRFVRDGSSTGPWRPAAGTFAGWPQRAAEITFLDPCCGSGHFLVEAFALLAALRIAEEGLSGEDAARVVLRDNLHGLEIDGRCVQIAAFNVALAAWVLAGSPVALPQPHIAWVGAQPPSRAEMAALATGDTNIQRALEALHDQFADAPLLGSLLEVGARDLLDADLRERGEAALAMLQAAEPERAEGAVIASGLFEAAAMLAKKYVLQVTNVPFRASGTVEDALRDYLEKIFPFGKRNLATAMLQRLLRASEDTGTVAGVTPKEWLSAKSFRDLRISILSDHSVNLIAGLGPNAFESIGGEVVNVALVIIARQKTSGSHKISILETPKDSDPVEKAILLAESEIKYMVSSAILQRKEAEIVSVEAGKKFLSDFVTHHQGLATGDLPRFSVNWWEVLWPSDRWVYWQGSVASSNLFQGCERALLWEQGRGLLHRFNEENKATRKNTHLRGLSILGKGAVLVTQMGALPASLYSGERYDDTTTTLVPLAVEHLAPVWCFLSSPEYAHEVRRFDSSIKVPAATLAKVEFDLEHWRQVAAERYPDGLPEPYSDDPTQWLFHGHPANAEVGTELHVGLARLAGCRWPAESDAKMRLSDLAKERIRQNAALPPPDADGLLTLHATTTDRPLADRLRAMLAAAYGKALTLSQEMELVRAADERLDRKAARDATLETWLRDRAFRQHCVLFRQRPFLWQVWDGGRDGFSAFLLYHRLDKAALEKLTYTLLGDWIAQMKAAGRTAEEGWARQLEQRLVAILEGEKPYDIFVRWKSLARQPIGWEPDLDDGVRLNIRPFVEAGVLRDTPKINWNKDRGSDPSSAPWFHLGPNYGEAKGARINGHHLTLAEKRDARAKAKS